MCHPVFYKPVKTIEIKLCINFPIKGVKVS